MRALAISAFVERIFVDKSVSIPLAVLAAAAGVLAAAFSRRTSMAAVFIVSCMASEIAFTLRRAAFS